MMTRQDFEKFATVIREHRADELKYGTDTVSLVEVAYDLADVMEGSNPAFDRDKFLSACGI